MRVTKVSYRDRHGKQQHSSKWYVEFVDQRDTTRRIPGFTSKSATEELGRGIDKLVGYFSASGGQTDPALQGWVSDLPAFIRRRLLKFGLLASHRVASSRPLSEHLAEFSTALAAKGNTRRHVDLLTARLKSVMEGCGFDYWGDLSASKIEGHLAGLRQGDKGISAQTFNFYLQAVKQFCRWMVKDGRAIKSPVDHLQGLNVRTDRRHDRRALSVDELRRLLTATTTGPVRLGICGKERALIYRLAVETGLRAGELRTLTVSAFNLTAVQPTVTVAAAYSKNRKESVLLLKSSTADEINRHTDGRTAADLAFAVPPRQHVAKMIHADLEYARQLWLKEFGNEIERQRHEASDFLKYIDGEKRVADFHALRHTFITNLALGGVHPKTAQTMARHSTFALTMERYSHSHRESEIEALNVLPDLTTEKPAAQAVSVLPSCLPEKGQFREERVDSGRLNTKKKAATQVASSPQNTALSNGEGEIRTPVALTGQPVFKTGAFNRSATSPGSA